MNELINALRKNFGVDTCEIASLGGTATWGIRFPEDIGENATVARFESFETPFGKSAPMKLINVCGKPVIRCQHQVSQYSKTTFPSPYDQVRVFWVLHKIGVKRVVVDGSGGGITARQGDIMLMSDFLDLQSNTIVADFALELGLESWKRVANPFCGEIKALLKQQIEQIKPVHNAKKTSYTIGRIYSKGVYVTSFPGLFESAAQIAWYKQLGGDIVGQTLGLVAKLARVCDMCLGAIHVVSNDAEGLSDDYDTHELGEVSLQQFYNDCGLPVAQAVWNTLVQLANKSDYHCRCQSYGTEMSGLPVGD